MTEQLVLKAERGLIYQQQTDGGWWVCASALSHRPGMAQESYDLAQLMAAAPELKKQRNELLAAAEAALPWLVKMIADGGHEQTVNPSNCVRALEGLEAAIAKARGV